MPLGFRAPSIAAGEKRGLTRIPHLSPPQSQPSHWAEFGVCPCLSPFFAALPTGMPSDTLAIGPGADDPPRRLAVVYIRLGTFRTHGPHQVCLALAPEKED